MQPIINVKQVSKRYPGAAKPALDKVDLQIFRGERIGLVGGNGSGKTTLIRLILNFIFADDGEIICEGKLGSNHLLQKMGYVPERQEGLHNFSPRELFRFAGEMNYMEPGLLERRISEVLDFTKLESVADRFLSSFSKGMIQRAQIGAALIHEPEILLLDEPLSGLDPEGQVEVGGLLERLQDVTLLMASHHLEQIETFCNSVIMIRQGKIIRRVDLAEMDQLVVTMNLDEKGYHLVEKQLAMAVEVVEKSDHIFRVRFQVAPDVFQTLMAAFHRDGIQPGRLRSRSILASLYQEESIS